MSVLLDGPKRMTPLLDGRMVDDSAISFADGNYHFTLNGNEDITDLISRREKIRLVPGFDVEKENYRISAERGHGAQYGLEPLPDSTAGIFADQIATDPLGAPLEALDKGVSQILSSTGVRTLIAVAVTGLVIYLVLKSRE